MWYVCLMCNIYYTTAKELNVHKKKWIKFFFKFSFFCHEKNLKMDGTRDSSSEAWISGLVSIPFMTYYMAAGTRWGIGYGMCQFWLCLDYMMSNASVLNLLLISFDRYFSVTRPLTYRPRFLSCFACNLLLRYYSKCCKSF